MVPLTLLFTPTIEKILVCIAIVLTITYYSLLRTYEVTLFFPLNLGNKALSPLKKTPKNIVEMKKEVKGVVL